MLLAEGIGADRGGDEQQPDQRRRSRAEQRVEVAPGMQEIGEVRRLRHP